MSTISSISHAGQALAGSLASTNYVPDIKSLASFSYETAQAMLDEKHRRSNSHEQ